MGKIYTPQTELHTHFIEILNAKEFFDFLMHYNISIPLNSDNSIDFVNGEYINIQDVYNNKLLYDKVLNELSFSRNSISDFDSLQELVYKRAYLLIECAKKNPYYEEESTYSLAVVTYELLKRSLYDLREEGIKYTEIGYGNYKVLRIINELMKSDFERIKGIDFKILMSNNRSRNKKCFKQNASSYRKTEYIDFIIGCDIHGIETPINYEEELLFSEKLFILLHAIKNKKNKGVLRIHSGEFNGEENKYNTEAILSSLDRIERERKIDILPTEIRIGHGINIDMNKRLSELLKRYKAIIEFNITSNHSLGNLCNKNSDLYKRLIDYYSDLDLPVVLSTDGHGVYGTTPIEEYELATILLGDRIDYIKKSDEMILNLKQKNNTN